MRDWPRRCGTCRARMFREWLTRLLPGSPPARRADQANDQPDRDDDDGAEQEDSARSSAPRRSPCPRSPSTKLLDARNDVPRIESRAPTGSRRPGSTAGRAAPAPSAGEPPKKRVTTLLAMSSLAISKCGRVTPIPCRLAQGQRPSGRSPRSQWAAMPARTASAASSKARQRQSQSSAYDQNWG